jgi:hypothetical protein
MVFTSEKAEGGGRKKRRAGKGSAGEAGEASENEEGAEEFWGVGAEGLSEGATKIAAGGEAGIAGDEIAAKGVGPEGFEAGEVGVVVGAAAG